MAKSKIKGVGKAAEKLRCLLCEHPITPTPKNHTLVALQRDAEDQPLRCPVSHCSGWVSHVEARAKKSKKGGEKAFWGCGECGAVWFDVKDLHVEIATITRRFAYRRKCYKKAGAGWKPSSAEPGDYERRVEKEPWDRGEDFVRSGPPRRSSAPARKRSAPKKKARKPRSR